MRIRIRVGVFSLLFVLVAPMVQAMSGGELLKEPCGAKQAGMGEAQTALAKDVNILYYNVAGLAGLRSVEITTMYALNAFGNKNANVTLGIPISQVQGAVALGITNLLGPTMEINHLDGTQEVRVSQNEYLVSLGYAQQLTTSLYAGVNAKVYHSTLIEEYKALAYGLDIGVHYAFSDLPGFCMGAALQNIGAEIKYEQSGDPMPTLLRIGAGYALELGAGHGITAAVDVLLPNDHPARQTLGVEYAWQQTLFARAGYKLGFDLDSLTVGVGVHVQGIMLDYAYSFRSVAESIHRLSLGYAFGGK